MVSATSISSGICLAGQRVLSYEKSGHPNIGMAAAVVLCYSDDLRILAGNPTDLTIDLHGVPAVDGSRDVVKRVSRFRTAENRVLRPVSAS